MTKSHAVSSVALDQLARSVAGEVVTPRQSSYGVAKQLELAQYDDVNPAAIVFCTNAGDVSASLRFAAQCGLPMAVRSGGHNYGGWSTSPGLIVDVSRLNRIAVSGEEVELGPGALNVDVLDALEPYGLVVSEGGCPTVAAGGFILGGGFGLLTRSSGMACDALVSAHVVLSDGSTVRASEDEHPDLFWALRGGGGGNYGVVTSFRVRPTPLAQIPFTVLRFAFDQLPDVLHSYTHWMVDAPNTIGGGAYVALPEAGDSIEPSTTVLLAATGTERELAAQTARLLASTPEPEGRQDGALSFRDLSMIVYNNPALTSAQQLHRREKHPSGQLERPAFGVERTRLCGDPLDFSASQAIAAAFASDRQHGQGRYLDVHMFGGTANALARTDTAFVHRTSLYSLNFRLTVVKPEFAAPAHRRDAQRWVDRGFKLIDSHSLRETYQNWMDPALPDWRESYFAENYPRLQQVKSQYDPGCLFRFPQGVEPPNRAPRPPARQR